MVIDLASERADYSKGRLAVLAERVRKEAEGIQLEGLTIFTAGSFARMEASEYSDVDLWFTYRPSGRTLNTRITNELRLFGRLIDVNEELGFPPFSNDAQYLRTHNIVDILKYLGGPVDDAQNHFTLRLLLILESNCILGQVNYDAALRDIIEAYYRDFSKHEDSFQPWFLMNDIMRYWKTMLLNYENKRNEKDSEDDITERRVKNFKIRFSRMTTCFATIAALASFPNTPTEENVYQLTKMTPWERLIFATTNMPDLEADVRAMRDEYSWFLDQTSLTKEALHAKFDDKQHRAAMFERAEAYGGLVYKLLLHIEIARGEKAPGLLRYLVI